MIPDIIFVLVLAAAIVIFARKVRQIALEIKLGKDLKINDNNKTR